MRLLGASALRVPISGVQAAAGTEDFIALSNSGSTGPESVLVYPNLNTVRVNGLPEPTLKLGGHEQSVTALAFSGRSSGGQGDGELLCSASSDRVLLWNLDVLLGKDRGSAQKRESCIPVLDSDIASDVRAVAFDPSQTLLAVSTGNEAKIAYTVNGQLFLRLEGHIGKVTMALFNPPRPQEVVTLSEDRTFKLWDLEQRSVLFQSSLLGVSPLLSLAFDPSLPRLAVGSADGRLRIFDLHRPRDVSQNQLLGATGKGEEQGAGHGVRVARELHCLDLEAKLRVREREKNFAKAKEELLASTPPVISSLPLWHQKGEALEASLVMNKLKAIENLTQDYRTISLLDEPTITPETETSHPLLDAFYIPGVGTKSPRPEVEEERESERSATAFRPPGTDSGDAASLIKDAPLLLVSTPHCLVEVNTRSYEIRVVVDFQDNLPSVWDSATSNFRVSAIGTALMSQAWSNPGGSPSGLIVVSAFDARVTLLTLAPSAEEEVQGECSSISGASIPVGSAFPSGTERTAISVFPQSAALPTSPLMKWEFKEHSPRGREEDEGKKADKRKTSKVAGKPGFKDQPVTFQKKIRSSGYGAGPPPVPLGGAKAKKPPRKRGSGNQTQGNNNQQGNQGKEDPLDSLEHQYPMNCGLLRYAQSKNNLPKGSLHSGPILQACYSRDASVLATCSVDNTVRTVRLPMARSKGEGTTYVGHTNRVNTVRWSHSNNTLLSTSSDGTARLWIAGRADSPLVFAHKIKNEPPAISMPALAKDAKTTSLSNKAASTESGRRSSKAVKNKANPPYNAEVVDGSFFYLDRFILLASGKSIFMYKYQVDQTPKDDLNRLANNSRYKAVAEFSPSDAQSITSFDCISSFLSHLVVLSCSNKTIKLLDVNTQQVIHSFEERETHSRAIHTVRLPSPSQYSSPSPGEEDRFLSSALDGTVKLWDLRSRKAAAQFSGHSNRVHRIGVSFSPCRRYIATGSEDKAACLYDMRTGSLLQRLSGHTDTVAAVEFSPKFPQLLSASYDSTVRFYTDVEL